jgi:ribose transport system substrate-binding protein
MRLSLRLLSLVFLLAAALPAAVLAGPKVGVLLKGRSAFWSAMEKGAIEAGTAAGAEVIVKAPISESDVSVQIQLLNALAAQGIEALVIAPCSKEALAAPVAALAAKGVKVVVVDSPLDGKAASVFVATDHEAAGVAAGKLLAKLVSDTDEVSFLKHSQTSGATGQREAGALAAFREAHAKSTVHGDIYASAEKDAEVEKANLLLKTYPATKAILASGTPGTMAMLRVLQEKKLGGAVQLVGFGFNLNPDVAAAIEQGLMQGWIAQLPKDVGAKGVQSALALLKGESVAPVVHTDFVAITKDNLKDAKVQALLAL